LNRKNCYARKGIASLNLAPSVLCGKMRCAAKCRGFKSYFLQDELARKSDLPYTTLTKIETNVITKPSIQTVMKIAKGLGISIDDLIKD
jgi:DNA-binding XRE family transcriptional regulator